MKGVHLLKYTVPGEEPISLILQDEKGAKLYLGNLDCMHNPKILQQHNIQSILSICTEEKIKAQGKYQQIFFDIHDNMHSKIIEVFSQAFEFIENSIKQKKNILVHCAAGISRSATIVLSFLMKKQSQNLENSLRLLKQCRPYVRPNPGFLLQLLDFEMQLFGKITSNLTADLTPFDVQREKKYKPQLQVPLRSSVQITKVSGSSFAYPETKRSERKPLTDVLTRITVSVSQFQPKACNF